MSNHKLSVIMPFVGEYPQVLFSIQSVAQSLILPNGDKKIPFEIIAVDNYCEQAKEQARVSAERHLERLENDIKDSAFGMCKKPDVTSIYEVCKNVYPTFENRSGGVIEGSARHWDWLKYIKVDSHLSHWEAKRIACEQAEGDVFLFLDSHVVPSGSGIADMFFCYTKNGNNEYMNNSSMHMPLTYKILEPRRSIYKLFIENDYFYSYKFTPMRVFSEVFEVPCMSTCGMMVSRRVYDSIGGWPKKMTMYGGGENFFNFTLSVCGYKKYIYPYCTLYHHGEKRDYHYTGDGMTWNRMVAHYLFGGHYLLDKFRSICKGDQNFNKQMAEKIKGDIDFASHRMKIKEIQKTEIEEWAKKWTNQGDA